MHFSYPIVWDCSDDMSSWTPFELKWDKSNIFKILLTAHSVLLMKLQFTPSFFNDRITHFLQNPKRYSRKKHSGLGCFKIWAQNYNEKQESRPFTATDTKFRNIQMMIWKYFIRKKFPFWKALMDKTIPAAPKKAT